MHDICVLYSCNEGLHARRLSGGQEVAARTTVGSKVGSKLAQLLILAKGTQRDKKAGKISIAEMIPVDKTGHKFPTADID